MAKRQNFRRNLGGSKEWDSPQKAVERQRWHRPLAPIPCSIRKKL
jgi:hypothetical protein